MLHLQPMLQRPEKGVSLRQFTPFLWCDELPIRQTPKTHKRVRHAQPIVTTAVRELKRLRNKLNLTNPAPAQLHVETTLLLRLPIDLLFRQPHTLERETHRNIRTKNMRRHRFPKLRKQFRRSGRSARTDQRLPLPILRGTHVITRRFCQRTRECAIAPVRTKPQIDAIRGALAARLAHDARDRFRQLDEILAITDSAALTNSRSRPVVGVEKHEIDIRSVV